MADIDPELGGRVASFDWVADGLTGEEWVPLSFARDLANKDVETAKILLNYPYMADELNELEYQTILSLKAIAGEDPEWARFLVTQPFMEPPFRDRDSFALEGMSLIVGAAPKFNIESLLKEQPWFSDGIDEYETALLSVMRSGAYIGPEYRRALIDTHKIVSKSIQLPLAGDADLIVITHKQLVDYDEIFTAMEVGARSHETFLGLPFPFTDIIFLVKDPTIWWTPHGGYFLGSNTASHFTLDHPFRISSIYHELGHYYRTGGYNRWIREGAANFLATIAEVSVGATTMERRMAFLDDVVHRSCDATIRESLVDWRESSCDYWLGERLLWNIYMALGEESMAAGLKGLVLHKGIVNDEVFYAVFLENTPPGQHEDFRRVYEKYHGGPVPK